MRIGGVDPGKKGVVAVVACGSDEAAYYKLQYNATGHLKVTELYAFLQMAVPTTLVLEKVQGRGGTGATQNFNFGFACGELNAALRYYAEVMHVSMHYVAPQAWQKLLHEGVDSKLDPKTKSKVAYERLFPHKPVPAGPKGGGADDNVIDALLLATYGVLKLGSGGLRKWQLVPCAFGEAPPQRAPEPPGSNVLPLKRSVP